MEGGERSLLRKKEKRHPFSRKGGGKGKRARGVISSHEQEKKKGNTCSFFLSKREREGKKKDWQ